MGKKLFCFLCKLLICTMVLGTMPVAGQYMKEDQYNQLPTRKVPESVMAKIQAHAKKRYPDNELLQQHTIDLQTKSFFKVNQYQTREVPSQELVMIKRNAAREFPNDYVRQLVSIDKQVKAYISKNDAVPAKTTVKPVASEQ